jgi:hypothetical protein
MSSLLKVDDAVSISFASYINADGVAALFSSTRPHLTGAFIKEDSTEPASISVFVLRAAQRACKAAQHFYLSHSSPPHFSSPTASAAKCVRMGRETLALSRFFGFAANNFLF